MQKQELQERLRAESSYLENLITDNTDLYLMSHLMLRQHALLMLFQQVEDAPRNIAGEWIESICGQSVFWLAEVEDFKLSDLDFAAGEETLFRQTGTLLRDILGFTTRPLSASSLEYLLCTTAGEEIVFQSQSCPVIEKIRFIPHLSQDAYLEYTRRKYACFAT